MKNAKLWLAAVAVVAVVGGVYASKARSTDKVYTRASGTTTCSVELPASTTIRPASNPQAVDFTFVTETPGVCPDEKNIYPGL